MKKKREQWNPGELTISQREREGRVVLTSPCIPDMVSRERKVILTGICEVQRPGKGSHGCCLDRYIKEMAEIMFKKRFG